MPTPNPVNDASYFMQYVGSCGRKDSIGCDSLAGLAINNNTNARHIIITSDCARIDSFILVCGCDSLTTSNDMQSVSVWSHMPG